MKDKELHKNKGGFKVPENYFENFEARLSEKLTTEFPEKDGFKVPENYFENLTDKVMDNIEEDNTSDSTPVRTLSSGKSYYQIGYAIAAGFALLILLNILPKSEKNINWNDVASTEIESYIEEGNVSFNAYEYANIFEDVDLSKIQIEEETIESEELLDYLYENVNSYENLIIEN
jgi:hypothetical protein